MTSVEQRLTRAQVRSDLAETLQQDGGDIDDQDNLVDLGLDSIRMMHLAGRWRHYGSEATFQELSTSPTLANWWGLLGLSGQQEE
ncbi:phosphopantetheine-binding protein [Streptomyces prunicolor]|uniref:phosphopantetheine-binding protein n=1 Tax=Streptomyces prunicolor TaxID=67348 RepID=UPI0037132E44